jgi:hypothetical protein
LTPLGVFDLRNGIIHHGKWIETENIDTGRLLLRDVEGWTGRFYLALLSTLFALILGTIIAIPIAAIVIGAEAAFTAPSVIGFIIGYSIVYGPLAFSFRSYVRRGDPVPGLYEKGIQHLIRFTKMAFIPYEEIKTVKVGKGMFFDDVSLIPKYRRRKWRVSKILLGEEGARVLQQLVVQPPEVIGTPKLVVYPKARDEHPKEEESVSPDLVDSRW